MVLVAHQSLLPCWDHSSPLLPSLQLLCYKYTSQRVNVGYGVQLLRCRSDLLCLLFTIEVGQDQRCLECAWCNTSYCLQVSCAWKVVPCSYIRRLSHVHFTFIVAKQHNTDQCAMQARRGVGKEEDGGRDSGFASAAIIIILFCGQLFSGYICTWHQSRSGRPSSMI